MKTNQKNLIGISLVALTLLPAFGAGCDFSPEAIAGKPDGGYGYAESAYSSGYGPDMCSNYQVTQTQLQPQMPAPAPSASPSPQAADQAPTPATSCLSPENVVTQMTVATDGTIHIVTIPGTDGQYPQVTSLMYGDLPFDGSNVITFNCKQGASTGGTHDWDCSPNSPVKPYDDSNYSSNVQAIYFHSMTLVNPACGASTVYVQNIVQRSCDDYSSIPNDKVDYADMPTLAVSATNN